MVVAPNVRGLSGGRGLLYAGLFDRECVSAGGRVDKTVGGAHVHALFSTNQAKRQAPVRVADGLADADKQKSMSTWLAMALIDRSLPPR